MQYWPRESSVLLLASSLVTLDDPHDGGAPTLSGGPVRLL
jgi:hypothetical protein